MARLALPSLSQLPAEAAHSGIRELANEALRTPGAIRLDVGQPNFPTPKHISEAGKRAIDENKTFYTHTQGLISLREKLGSRSRPIALPAGLAAWARSRPYLARCSSRVMRSCCPTPAGRTRG